MNGLRCRGMLVNNQIFTEEGAPAVTRCAYCGDLTDPTNIRNRSAFQRSVARGADTSKVKLKKGRTMKRYGYLLVVAVLGISVAACVSPQGRPDNTASGALAGALVGGMAGRPGPGALVGAV